MGHRLRLPSLVVWVSALAAIPVASAAQGTFGTGSQITVIPASAFQPETSAAQWSSNFGVQLTPTVSADTRFVAPLGLPSGANVEEIRLLVSDADGATDITAYVLNYGHGSVTTDTCGPGYFWTNSTSGSPGSTVLTLTGSPITVRSEGLCSAGGGPPFDAYFQVYIEVILASTDHSLSGALVKWHRQVSTAPVTATFNDVPTTHPFFRTIEALAASGITTGCGGGNFCPNDVVTRAQLAKFLSVGLGLYWP